MEKGQQNVFPQDKKTQIGREMEWGKEKEEGVRERRGDVER